MKRSLSIALVILVVIAGMVGFSVRSYLVSPVDDLAEAVLFEVKSGASLSGVARDLADLGVLARPGVFVAWGRFTGQAASIQTGEYELRPGVSPKGILDQLVAGQVKLYAFTILEGWTTRDLMTALAAKPAIAHTLAGLSPEEQRAMLGLEAPHLEGQFFPDTYLVPRGTADVEVLRQAAELMQSQLSSAWKGRAVGLPLKDPYELLILASIVERETAVDAERPQVAGVFIRRLHKRMKLQTDPTVIYGLGDRYDGNLTRKNLVTDTPYNTYTRRGLPPTPIGMPGAASLDAAAHPDSGDSLYFVATGEPDGSHVFSRTLDEHNAAVAAYIAKLRHSRSAAPAEKTEGNKQGKQ